MITLVERYSEESREIYQSNKIAGIESQFIVLVEDGFLPDDIITPYRFFVEESLNKDFPKYFNKVDIPKFWEIESTNNEGTVYDMGEQRARLIYKASFRSRVISEVHWLDKKGKVIKKDLYSKYGHRFSSIILNDGINIFQKYYNMKNQVIIYHNFVTGHMILNWKGKDCLFENSNSFYRFFLTQTQYDLSSILINSLSVPLLVTLNLKHQGNDLFFLQETFDSVPGNLQYILEHTEKRNFKVIVPSEEDYHKLLKMTAEVYHHRIVKLGYIYRFKKDTIMSRRILITTHSDQIYDVEKIIRQLPEFEFNVAALTEMSDRLTTLNKYDNVNLYPGISPKGYEELFETCAIYLDINEGSEVMTSIRKAFEHQLLILGYEDTIHQRRYVPSKHLFKKEHVQDLINYLKQLAQNDSTFYEGIQLQKTKANAVSKERYKQIMNTLQ